MRFWLDCIPPRTTAQQKGQAFVRGKMRFFKKQKTKDAETLFYDLLRPHLPEEQMTGAVFVSLSWVFPYLGSTPKKIRDVQPLLLKDTSPDYDNLGKLFHDCMQEDKKSEWPGFFKNDSQIASGQPNKFFGYCPGIAVWIEPMQTLEDLGAILIKVASEPYWFLSEWEVPEQEVSNA